MGKRDTGRQDAETPTEVDEGYESKGRFPGFLLVIVIFPKLTSFLRLLVVLGKEGFLEDGEVAHRIKG